MLGSPLLTAALLVGLFVVCSRGMLALWQATFGDDDAIVRYFEHAERPEVPPTLYVVRTPPFDWNTDDSTIELRTLDTDPEGEPC